MSLVALLRPAQRATNAIVRASACRGYVVELDPQAGGPPRMLQNLSGDVIHFRSLDRVRIALRRRGVQRATLVQKLACEETSALGVSLRAEDGVALLGEGSA